MLEQLGQQFPTLAYSPADVQATLVELTAKSVSDAIVSVTDGSQGELFVCGGGALNAYLMSRLQDNLATWTYKPPTKLGCRRLWVEAVAFAWLAQQTIFERTE